MELTVTESADPVKRVRLAGRLDSPGADEIGVRYTAVVAAGGGRVIVDLSGVTFIASMGLRLLISAARALHLKDGKVVLYGATPQVQGVFDDAAFGQILPIVATEAEALAEVAR